MSRRRSGDTARQTLWNYKKTQDNGGAGFQKDVIIVVVVIATQATDGAHGRGGGEGVSPAQVVVIVSRSHLSIYISMYLTNSQ
jgi:hypothetical protein